MRALVGGQSRDRLDDGHGDQLAGERRGRVGDDFFKGSGLQDLAVTEECHEVTDLADDRHLMGDDDDGNTRDVTDAAQQRQNLRSGLGVEGTRGLITQKDARVVSQGSGNTHALALTTGKLGRIGVPASGQADEFQQFIDAGATLVRGSPASLSG